ncbi:MAG: mechanosensitive ion channel family protein [Prolixibacteraceae bacterium]|nr:mechanosensitive ion channel family protein [Prolixibacteraceae bacterium]
MEQLSSIFESLLKPTAVLFVLIVLLVLNAWVFKKVKSTNANGNIAKGAISFFLSLVGILVFILVLPIEKPLKGQIIAFFGIIISAGIALSSTTVLGNLIAGIMNNSMNRFRNGDLIKIDDFHGRVIRKSIFHTEIQLEDSNFITIPNLYISNNPVKLIRKANTVISTSVSLGYDVPRGTIEKALKDAANEAGLSDPYVYVTDLGDYSVVYKIHGFLADSSKYFTTRSLLNVKVMDVLHEAKVEIVSPTFMNQRRVDEKFFIPKKIVVEKNTADEKSPEDLIFDEAIKSGKIEIKKDYLKEIDEKQEALKAKLKDLDDGEEVEKIKTAMKRNDEMKKRIEKNISEQIEKDKDSSK